MYIVKVQVEVIEAESVYLQGQSGHKVKSGINHTPFVGEASSIQEAFGSAVLEATKFIDVLELPVEH